ncbi:MAG: M48 family metalloprotease [Alphaproteobacteria bacterium]|nr:M48 family metalloprotease [Alphaproteobacteria bacterium]
MTVALDARYLDGKTAAQHAAVVRLGEDEVEIVMADGAVHRWAASDVRLAAGDTGDGPVRLTTAEGGATLIVDSPEARRWVDAGEVKRHRTPPNRRLQWVVGGALGALGLFALAWTTVVPGLIAAAIPASWERPLGRVVVEQVMTLLNYMEKEPVRRCEAGAGRAALDRLVRRLRQASPPGTVLEVDVVSSSIVNALTAPGGHILLLHGLIEDAKSPEEVAGVLAHEIGHALHRHPTGAAIRDMGLSTLIDFVLGGGFNGGAVSTAAKALVNSSYGRAAEREADEEALRVLAGAGISARGLQAFFARLAAEENPESGALRMVASHPQSAERAAMAAEAAAAGGGAAMSGADWQALRAICDTGG